MNVTEGMRRLGLLAGSVGMLVGLGMSYFWLRDYSERHKAQKEFDALLHSAAIKKLCTPERLSENVTLDFIPLSTQPLNKDGIQAVHFNEARLTQQRKLSVEGIDWIKTSDGRYLHRTDIITWYKAYTLAVVFPFIGFVLPWGTILALTWVGKGFFMSPQ